MHKIKGIAIALIFISACGQNGNEKSNDRNAVNIDKLFDAYKVRFIEKLWKVFPDWASGQGYHKYDGVLVVPTDDVRKAENDFAQANLDSLKAYSLNSLSSNNRTDYYLIENKLRGIIWDNQSFKSYEWNPSEYNVVSDISSLLTGSTEKLEARLINIYNRLKDVPAYYAAAKKYIKNPTLEHTQLAIEQNLNSIPLIEGELVDAIKRSRFKVVAKTDYENRIAKAVSAIKDYVEWLKALKNDNPRSFRLGKELYQSKFQFDIQSRFTPEEVYRRALKRKGEIHSEMAKLSKKLWPKYMGKEAMPVTKLELIRKMIDKISVKHVSRDSFQTTIEKQIPELVEFIKRKNLIYIDSTKPLLVRKEPAYMAGVASASINAPGPYDKEANTYYNVGSLAGYSAEKAESFLREYNYYILQILNIHEAIPGHYTQLVYSNRSPSLIKSVFGNGAMVEGWAVYAELMMMENGYGNNEPEMWLMYYKWHLRTVCNTILDYSVHVLGIDKDAAMKLLVDEAFQQKAEAEGKFKRVSLTQVQLCSYFAGFTEIYDLREELKQKMGNKFDLKTFHEKFLSYGSAPVKYIHQLMLEEK